MPEIDRSSISVFVRGEFARKALQTPFANNHAKRLQELGEQEIARYGFKKDVKYCFEDIPGTNNQSALVQQFTLGSGGKWLAADVKQFVLGNEKLLKYYEHNIDTYREADALLRLVALYFRHVPHLISSTE
jgi:hypothetical protein